MWKLMKGAILNEQNLKERRVTIDLTAIAAQEVDKLKALTGLKTADIFRHALSIFRLYVESSAKGQEIYLVNPRDASSKTRIEVPLLINRGGTSG